MDERKKETFKEEAYKHLKRFNGTYLRNYGRRVGVNRPTDTNKPYLIEQIIGIQVGEIQPIEISTRGKPVKNDYFPPEIALGMDELVKKYLSEYVEEEQSEDQPFDFSAFSKMCKEGLTLNDSQGKRIEYENDSRKIYHGQLQFIKGVFRLIPLNGVDEQPYMFMDEEMVQKNDLREGDIISCYGLTTEKAIVCDKVLAVNNLVLNTYKRNRFSECTARYPNARISTYHQELPSTLTAKYVQWLLPIAKGHRVGVFGPSKAGKSFFLYQMAESAKKLNRDLKVLVALIDQSPEIIGKYRKIFSSENLVYTTYEDDVYQHVFAAEFLLKRAKSLVEMGKDVLLIVDSFTSLAGAYNETDESSGGKVLECGLESKTVHYLKRIFGSARCFEEGGSITVIGSVQEENWNPIDGIIGSNLSSIANVKIYLKNELARKRIFPAIDYARTVVEDGNECVLEEERMLYEYIREEFLPKHGEEELLNRMSKSTSLKEFIHELKK